MNKLLLTVLMIAATMLAFDADAQSRRLGGGLSSGRQSQNVTRQAAPAPKKSDATAAPAAPAAPATAPQSATPPKPASPWKGMLGGALLGLGLGALLSHFGVGEGMAGIISTMLMIGLFGMAAYFIYRLFARRTAGAGPQPAFAGGPAPESSSFKVPEIGSRIEPQMAASPNVAAQDGAAAVAAPWGVTPDFDVPAFLRSAKSYFIRLQAAWDKGDSADLREFTTPEMFAELKLQVQERGPAPNMTDVVTLEAELLGVEVSGNDHLASVKFSGTIKDAPDAPAAPFAEVWNIAKPAGAKDGWLLAGIQQIS